VAQWSGKPVRLQLRRTKGFNLQVESVKVNGRQAVNCARPGPYGNAYKVDDERSPVEACAAFHADLKTRGVILRKPGGAVSVTREQVKEKLAGKNLACFCPLDAPWCHVDTLLEVANGN
jgi:hypothetical protein